MVRFRLGVLVAAMIAFMSLGQHASAQNATEEAAQALAMWQPVSIERVDFALIVTTKERRVTENIYQAMMLAGMCAFVQAGRIRLAGITGVVILNRFEASGWVFEGGASECKSIMAFPRDARSLRLLGHSHLY